MSTELSRLGGHQQSNDNSIIQNTAGAVEPLNDPNQHSTRNAAETEWQNSNFSFAEAWFNSSQPMTRSRSSELRKRYAAMQTTQTPLSMETMHNVSAHGLSNLTQDFTNPNRFFEMSETPNQFSTFMSPSNSSSSTFNTAPQVDTIDKVSSAVSMLKGTLECKKLNNRMGKGTFEDDSFMFYGAEEGLSNTGFNQEQENHIYEVPKTFQDVLPVQVQENHEVLQTVEESFGMEIEGFVTSTNLTRIGSRETSQSESSAAAPIVSNGFDACDGTSNSGQTLNMCENSRKQNAGRSSDNGSIAKDIMERIYDNPKDDRKKGSLVRHGSVTSLGSVDKGDPTKKRRVERSRKMAEAKERNLTPAVPSDMQSILKRCENLEKEVRSLKLNLYFMNRKDSEQTKQIEELQKQNEDLKEEKERHFEEIERIISETGKM